MIAPPRHGGGQWDRLTYRPLAGTRKVEGANHDREPAAYPKESHADSRGR